jgi:hypothetical protein
MVCMVCDVIGLDYTIGVCGVLFSAPAVSFAPPPPWFTPPAGIGYSFLILSLRPYLICFLGARCDRSSHQASRQGWLWREDPGPGCPVGSSCPCPVWPQDRPYRYVLHFPGSCFVLLMRFPSVSLCTYHVCISPLHMHLVFCRGRHPDPDRLYPPEGWSPWSPSVTYLYLWPQCCSLCACMELGFDHLFKLCFGL